jgi:uncharacterized protein
MLLDISRLRGGVEQVERRFEPSRFPTAHEEFRVTAPVNLVAEVRKDGLKVRLTGHLEGAIECDCSRCLEPFAVPVDAKLDLLFLAATENVGTGGAEDEREIEDDDLGVSYYKDEEIDLGEIVREQFYLALPMKPLCREDCRGLCPICGANRNRDACTCQAQWVDPRFEALKAIGTKK